MNLSHRKAFELLQRSMDGPLDAGDRADLDSHMAVCSECQIYAVLQSQLEEQATWRHSVDLPSEDEIRHTIHETQKRFRRWHMINRFFINPVRTVAWVAAAVALAVAVVWVFDIAREQNQTGSSDVSQIVQEGKVDLVEVTREVEVTRQVLVAPVFDAEAEKQKIESVSKGIATALAQEDSAALLKFVHEDWKEFYSDVGGQGTMDREDLLQNMLPGFETSETDVGWILTPELAVRTFQATLLAPDQQEFRYYATEVYQKIDGQWMSVHSHLTYIEP
jgi:hypothetical protein